MAELPTLAQRLRARARDLTDPKGATMERWDLIRRQVETAKGSDLPRMNFESLMDEIGEFLIEAADIVERYVPPAVITALWQAWKELNEIKARDGIPWTHEGVRALVSEAYFAKVVDDCAEAYKLLTGKDIPPWPPRHNSW